MVNGIKVREFRTGDGSVCSEIFSKNLEKYYTYLNAKQKKAMLSVNRPEDFERMADPKLNKELLIMREGKKHVSKWENNKIFLIVEKDKIIGYFHIGKEGNQLRLKRLQVSQSGKHLFKTAILPSLERYKTRWKCAEIVVHAPQHWGDFLQKIPHTRIQPIEIRIGGKQMPTHNMIKLNLLKNNCQSFYTLNPFFSVCLILFTCWSAEMGAITAAILATWLQG